MDDPVVIILNEFDCIWNLGKICYIWLGMSQIHENPFFQNLQISLFLKEQIHFGLNDLLFVLFHFNTVKYVFPQISINKKNLNEQTRSKGLWYYGCYSQKVYSEYVITEFIICHNQLIVRNTRDRYILVQRNFLV